MILRKWREGILSTKAGKKQEAWASDTNKFQNLMIHKIKRIRDIIKYYR